MRSIIKTAFEKYKDFTEKIKLHYILIYLLLLLNIAFDTLVVSAAFHPDIYISTVAVIAFIVAPCIASCFVLKPWARDNFKSDPKHYLTIFERVLLRFVPSFMLGSAVIFFGYFWIDKYEAYSGFLSMNILSLCFFALISASRFISVSVVMIEVVRNDIDIGVDSKDKGTQIATVAFLATNSLFYASLPIIAYIRIYPHLDFS